MTLETTLITGASSGIGLHLAHEFAWHDHPLVLVAPVESELNTLAEELRRLYGVPVQVIAMDLERSHAAQEIFDELQNEGIEIDILVNNAGHGYYGKWWDLSIEKDLSMMKLNIEAVLRLTKIFLPAMLSRNRGRILNTASVVGFQPAPLLATYAATKAFVLSWSEALATELNDTAITVTALCPGATDTDFFSKAGAENIRGRQSDNVSSPQDVAKAGYEGLMDEELFVVPGGMNKVLTAARRFLPVSVQAKVNERANREVPPDKRLRYRGEKEFARQRHPV